MIEWLNWLSAQPFFRPTVDIVTIVILGLTAIVGYMSSRASSIANELSMFPLIGIYFANRDFDGDLVIRNSGEGVAYDIQILPSEIIFGESGEIPLLKMYPSGTNILVKNEEKTLETEVYLNGKRVYEDRFMLFILRYLKCGVPIYFKNATGQQYFTLIRVSDNKIDIVVPPKKLTIRWHIHGLFEYNVFPVIKRIYTLTRLKVLLIIVLLKSLPFFKLSALVLPWTHKNQSTPKKSN